MLSSTPLPTLFSAVKLMVRETTSATGFMTLPAPPWALRRASRGWIMFIPKTTGRLWRNGFVVWNRGQITKLNIAYDRKRGTIDGPGGEPFLFATAVK